MALAPVGDSISPAFDVIHNKPVLIDRWGGGSGSLQIVTSTDGGTTMLPITVAGGVWGLFLSDCSNEEVCTPTQGGRTFYAKFVGVSGTVNWAYGQ